MKKNLLTLICIAASSSFFAQTELLTNGDFETGDLTGWLTTATNGVDQGSGCIMNWAVQLNSTIVCCCVDEIVPTEGTMSAFTSFDSDTPLTDWMIEQVVALPAASLTAANVSFDFRANFDFSFGTATIPRELSVDFYTTGGSFIANVFSDSTFNSAGILNIDYSENVDVLASLFGLQGTNIVLRFTASVPEPNMAPSKALIDAVSFLVTEDDSSIGENSTNVGFSYYPNPVNDILFVEAEEEIERVEIYDLAGKRIISQTAGAKDVQLNTSELESGSYLVKAFSDDNELGMYKFTKK